MLNEVKKTFLKSQLDEQFMFKGITFISIGNIICVNRHLNVISLKYCLLYHRSWRYIDCFAEVKDYQVL